MNSKYDMILFLGQSNMQGQTDKLTEDNEVENALEYRFLTDSLVPVKNPVGENIARGMTEGLSYDSGSDWAKCFDTNLLCAPCYRFINMIPEFTRSYIKATGHRVLVVSACKGATTTAMWMPGTEGFDALITKTKAAIKKIGKENIRHFLCVWLQGESDAIDSVTGEKYEENLTLIKNKLKEEAGLEKFGIIKVGRFCYECYHCEENLAKDEVIRNAQEELCIKDTDFVMLTRVTDKMFYPFSPYQNENAAGHYSSFGQELLGRLSGKALAEAIKC